MFNFSHSKLCKKEYYFLSHLYQLVIILCVYVVIFILNYTQRVYFKSKRSAFITLFHAFTKSLKNCSSASAQAYTSAIERSSACEPNTKSARVAVHFGVPVLRSLPKYTSLLSSIAFHWLSMVSRFTKKSLVNLPGRSVNTPCLDPSKLMLIERKPPNNTVISGAVKVNKCALSINNSSVETARFFDLR